MSGIHDGTAHLKSGNNITKEGEQLMIAFLSEEKEEQLAKNFNENTPQIALSLRPISIDKIRLVVRGRAPTNYGNSQGHHFYSLGATTKALQLLLNGCTVDQAIKKLFVFHSYFQSLFKISYGNKIDIANNSGLLTDASSIIWALYDSNYVIPSEMKCPYIEEYLTICFYVMGHLPETTIKLANPSKYQGEGHAFDKLMEMNTYNSSFNLNDMKNNLGKLIDSTVLEIFIRTRPKGEDILPIVVHQIMHIHFLMQALNNVKSAWLGDVDLISVGPKIDENLLTDLQDIIFNEYDTIYKESSGRELNTMGLIKGALGALQEAYRYDQHLKSLPNWKTSGATSL